ncbi:hypothetical protein Psfp_03256 [Pelotomaculum sp. FP]|uniref:hypothetical protein n=1 Tax=Pelotomaculum sp. FP TaxID=261474 RepID=UPI001065B2B8|nr:hypothetical protein [Pelotomaculum sp. FP]TEB13986.1 hypothetical protein Psfp_03256 [Pelotomaculum sp. FP]
MLLSFVHADHYMDDVNSQQALHDLADFLFREQEYLTDAADVVLSNDTVMKFQYWKIGYLRKVVSKKKEELRKKFTDLLATIFELAWTPPKGETEIGYLRRLRGGILEVLVSRFLMVRYPCMGCNCHVLVDAEPLKGSNGAPKTVDVAGVDKLDNPQQGELYECKVGSFHIKKYHLEFIGNTRLYLDQNGLTAVLAAVVSFENEVLLKASFRRLGYSTQKMISRKQLKSLVSYEKVKSVLTAV